MPSASRLPPLVFASLLLVALVGAAVPPAGAAWRPAFSVPLEGPSWVAVKLSPLRAGEMVGFTLMEWAGVEGAIALGYVVLDEDKEVVEHGALSSAWQPTSAGHDGFSASTWHHSRGLKGLGTGTACAPCERGEFYAVVFAAGDVRWPEIHVHAAGSRVLGAAWGKGAFLYGEEDFRGLHAGTGAWVLWGHAVVGMVQVRAAEGLYASWGGGDVGAGMLEAYGPDGGRVCPCGFGGARGAPGDYFFKATHAGAYKEQLLVGSTSVRLPR